MFKKRGTRILTLYLNNRMSKSKRSISGVVETIILILLVMVGISLIAAFLIPFVRNNMQGAGSCVNVLDQIHLNPTYTCFYKEYLPQKFNGTIVNVELGKIKPEKLVITLTGSGVTKSIEIVNGTLGSANTLNMYYHGAGGTDPLIVPGENEGVTYNIPFYGSIVTNWGTIPPTLGSVEAYTYRMNVANPIRVRVDPVVNGKQCEGETLDIQQCGPGI